MEVTGLLCKIGTSAKLYGVTFQKTLCVFCVQNCMMCVLLPIGCHYTQPKTFYIETLPWCLWHLCIVTLNYFRIIDESICFEYFAKYIASVECYVLIICFEAFMATKSNKAILGW